MTIPQKKYFIKRIDMILVDKLASVEHKTLAKDTQLLEDFKSKKVETISLTAIKNLVKSQLTRLDSGGGYGYSGYGTNMQVQALIKNYDKWEEKFDEMVAEFQRNYQAELDAIQDESTKIKDICMFGSEELAHKMLEEFSKWQWKQGS